MDENYNYVSSRFASAISAGIVQIHRSFSEDILATFSERSIDFAHIDGDHTKEGTIKDLRQSFRIVRGGGLICGDDYSLGNWWKDGVIRALHTFLEEAAVVIELVVGSQFVLRKFG